MCVMAIAIACSAAFPLVLVHNREEEFSREAADVFLNEETGIISAVDKESGGTWMGLNSKSGRLLALTNVRTKHTPPPNRESRGKMVKEFLEGFSCDDAATQPYFAYHTFQSANVFDGGEFWFKTSTPEIVDDKEGIKWIASQQQIPPGQVSGCSNEMGTELNRNSWPKTVWLTEKVAEYLTGSPETPNEETAVKNLLRGLGDLLSTVNKFAEDELPDLSFTPLEESEEVRRQNGPFIPGQEGYGTQCQTIVLTAAKSGTTYYCYRRTMVEVEQVKGLEWSIQRIPRPLTHAAA